MTNYLLKAIYKLLDFEENVPPELVKDEFKKKYSDTLCLINGRLELIRNYRNDTLFTRYKDIECVYTDTPITIQPFLPETGLYQKDQTLLFYVYRIPQRQWKKSFHSDNYKIVNIYGSCNYTIDIFETCTYKKETTIFKNIVFIHQVAVGILKGIVIHVINNHFYDEIKELWPQYPSTLGALDQLS